MGYSSVFNSVTAMNASSAAKKCIPRVRDGTIKNKYKKFVSYKFNFKVKKRTYCAEIRYCIVIFILTTDYTMANTHN
jgi:hypothetical protein